MNPPDLSRDLNPGRFCQALSSGTPIPTWEESRVQSVP
jgi:hypothetical protein